MALITFCLLITGLALTGCQSDSTDTKAPASKSVDNSPLFNKLHRESTMGALNAIRAAQTQYMGQTGSYGSLSQLVNSQLLDSRFAGERPLIMGYVFTISANSSAGYTVNADPKENEGRHYYMDQNNTIRFNDKTSATSSDPVFNGV